MNSRGNRFYTRMFLLKEKVIDEMARTSVFAASVDKMKFRNHEAVGTQTRGDPGDSLKKAAGSADDIV